MINEIIHLDDEAEARRILMRLGNGMTQVEMYIEEWKKAKEASKPVITTKVVTESPTVKTTLKTK